MILKLEGHCDRPNATIEDVCLAVGALGRPNGPTYLIVEAENGDHAQTAGTDGRYVVESRTVLGEGFTHFRAFQPCGKNDPPAVVHYRQRCSKHPPRRCPIRVRESEVCQLVRVEEALVAFTATGERIDSVYWRDVTAEMLRDYERHQDDDDGEIRQITAGGQR